VNWVQNILCLGYNVKLCVSNNFWWFEILKHIRFFVVSFLYFDVGLFVHILFWILFVCFGLRFLLFLNEYIFCVWRVKHHSRWFMLFWLNHDWKFWRMWNVPLVLLERSWWEDSTKIYLVRFGFRMWELLIFKRFLLLKIQINSKKPGFARKNQLRIWYSTWTKGTGHTSLHDE